MSEERRNQKSSNQGKGRPQGQSDSKKQSWIGDSKASQDNLRKGAEITPKPPKKK